MSEYAEVEELTTHTLDEDDVTLASGKKMRVRAMSRGEVFAMQKTCGGDEAAKERRIISTCSVVPKLTEKQVGEWQRGPAGGDLDAITDRIQELSKLKAGADKAAYLEFETSPDLEFEFYLAQKLTMTVGQLRREMSNEEFVRWSIYYRRIAQQEELERLKAGGSSK